MEKTIHIKVERFQDGGRHGFRLKASASIDGEFGEFISGYNLMQCAGLTFKDAGGYDAGRLVSDANRICREKTENVIGEFEGTLTMLCGTHPKFKLGEINISPIGELRQHNDIESETWTSGQKSAYWAND